MPVNLARLKSRFDNNPQFKPFIKSIVFPAYKNLEFGAELSFDFPLTFLIGKNGTNKSSVLQALYGCPEGKSVGEYWFSTHVDSIRDIDGRTPAYFYRYASSETTEIPEILKTRISRADDPDYWEPSRPILAYGMRMLPAVPQGVPLPPARRRTRWNVMSKEVLYLDFRAEISAFDKAFYKNDTDESRPTRRNRLRKQSRPLKQVIDDELQTYTHYNKERVTVNHSFTDEELGIVSEILDTEYSKIVYVEHDFYLSGSFSIYVTKGEQTDYSEAFAGSGEASVIRLVYALSQATEGTLVLLDEPETSLHIAAQYKLRDYILEMINTKYLQVVISTHSPFFTKGMPDYAIKILEPNSATGRIRIINKAPADESSFYLGYHRNDANKVNVYVEDKLAQALLQRVANLKLTPSQRDRIVITPYIGGKGELYNLAATEAIKASSNTCFIFDGDAYVNIPDPDTIAPNRNSALKNIITMSLGSTPHIPFDSNTSDANKANRYRQFLSYCQSHFQLMPFDFPEQFIVSNHATFNSSNISDPKATIRDYTMDLLSSTGETHAEEIMVIQRTLIGQIDSANPVFDELANLLINTLAFVPSV